ncbi:MAG: ribonuclease III [Clostridiales bacterium]|nr:ribonuclease III [Clostridiales bacterium]
MNKSINTTALAYIGDAVYELEIRRKLIDTGKQNVDVLHREAVRYVSSSAQAKAVREMLKEFLTENEVRLVKRARNRKITSMPKNAEVINYKLATGFEALIGSLYLSEDTERLNECVDRAIEIIGGQNE